MNLFFILPAISLAGGLLTLIYHFRQQSTNLLTNVFILISLLLSFLLIKNFNNPMSFGFPVFIKEDFIFPFKLQIDNLSIIMLIVINIISFIIHYYSSSYLATDITQGRFMAQLSILTASVSLLVMSGNLFTAFIAWQFIGLSLYLLLNHYHYDSNANRSAKKKFVINRIGDFCFLASVILCYKYFGSSDFDLLNAMRMSHYNINFYNLTIPANSLIAFLIFIAAATKSAQFPFHIWLPDTMQAPTPVSAIMHAGVINAGGFLLARISLLIPSDSHVYLIIYTVGIITLLLASFFNLTQNDIKKQLAYSTMAQMGFMIMQCGLGLYVSAIFHLIAHGFLKAFLFLSSGNALRDRNFHSSREKESKLSFLTIILLLLALSLYYHFFIPYKTNSNIIVLEVFIFITLFQVLLEIASLRYSLAIKFVLGITLLGFTLSYLLLIYYWRAWLIIPSYSLTSDSYTDNYKVLLASVVLLIQALVWLSPFLTKKLPQKFTLYLYHLSRNKLFIEDFYRKLLLNPYRDLGDFLNIGFTKFNYLLFNLCIVISIVYTYLGIIHYQLFSNLSSIIINQLIYIILIIAANRALTINQLNYYFLLAQINLINIGLYAKNAIPISLVVFQIINCLLIFLAITVINLSQGRVVSKKVIRHNLLLLNSSYFAIMLFLLIGLPGTASFISEVNVLFSIAHENLLCFFMMGGGFIMLTVAILHALQTHVFSVNSEFLSKKNYYLSFWENLFILTCIAINIFNGLSPKWLLSQISWLLS